MFTLIQVFFGNDHMVHFIMGKRLHFRCIYISIHIGTGRLLGKYHGHAEIYGCQAGNTNAGSFDGQNLIYFLMGKYIFKFFPQLTDKRHIDLMIKETVHFQYVSRFNHSIGQYLLL